MWQSSQLSGIIIIHYSWRAQYRNIAAYTISRQFALSYASLEAIESRVWIIPRWKLSTRWMTPWCLLPSVRLIFGVSGWLEHFMENSSVVVSFMELGCQPNVQSCRSREKCSCVVGCGRLLVGVGGGQRRIWNEMEELLSLRLAAAVVSLRHQPNKSKNQPFLDVGCAANRQHLHSSV